MSGLDERTESAGWDVFLSYSRTDAQKAGLLASALRGRGLRLFVDDTAVDDFASITGTITRALAQSKVVLALYSADYPRRRACQWELTYAYLAGQREGDPRRRVLVINPEPAADHVHPVELRDARHWPWPTTAQAMDRLADRVAEHAAGLATTMGAAAAESGVPWLPAPARTGSARFVDRLAEQWRIHTALHRHRAPLVSQAGSGRAAQLRGMPGIGKSLLAQEYALRFAPAYPGGIFWFDLHTAESSTASQAVEAYADQVATVVVTLTGEADAQSLPRLLSRLAVVLGERGAPCLWVVDGVPDGLSEEQLHLLRAPNLVASTLITTRSLHYTPFAETIDVTPLPDESGYALLTSQRRPRGEAERSAAHALVHDVGGHPQALDLLADLAAAGGFTQVRNRLHAPGTDILTSQHTVPAHQAPSRRRLTAALLTRPLTGHRPVDDVLRLLALACPAPLPRRTLEAVLSTVPPYDPWESATLVAEAVDALLGSGALRPEPFQDASWTIHPLLARAVRRHDTDTSRQEDLRRSLLHTLAAPSAPPAHSAPKALPAKSRTASRRSSPGPIERAAAFDLQVELVTRIGVQPLHPGQGSLREALTSLHSLFSTTREVLHRVAAEVPAPLTLPRIATTLINHHLRPFLATWHPALQEHEATRPQNTSAVEHERRWERSTEMRQALTALHAPLVEVAKELADLCGVDLTPSPAPSP
ncbi:TIR domain-containing protein [Streptomyces echinoruber]|uniref:TIR domain-containing protein n=1 Tax=Streptomyces echinoruber TaxID=68898 RepID=A0A918RAM9_9ACTN|nr:TIR domain-containing protein [Streptomyces echinoruber]GGZ89954.1 hypothetical protein GCM10010389_30390 [Streptomyces echinoruber]